MADYYIDEDKKDYWADNQAEGQQWGAAGSAPGYTASSDVAVGAENPGEGTALVAAVLAAAAAVAVRRFSLNIPFMNAILVLIIRGSLGLKQAENE